MNLKYLILFLSVLFSTRTIAQQVANEPSHPLNQPVSIAELQMKSYDKDTSAEALMLYDYGTAQLYENDYGFTVKYNYIQRIKIFKKTAFDYATIKVPLYFEHNSKNEFVTGTKGTTYNLENGQIIVHELKEDAIFKTKVEKNYQTLSFTLPQVKEGSIIEFSYTIESPYPFKPRNWYFQTSIPVLVSEYKFKSPSNFGYRIVNQGLSYLTYNKDLSDRELFSYHWIARNIPPIKEEPYLTSLNNFYSMIHFELAEYWVHGMADVKSFTTTWANFDRDLLNDVNFGGAIKRTGFLSDYTKAIKLIAPQDTLERIKTAYRFIQQNMTWNGELSKYSENNSLKDVFQKKIANSGEINLMLIGLLQDLGIDADPVIISTRKHGIIWKDYPALTRFNNVIGHVVVGGQTILLDATNLSMSLGMLPEYCINGEGRLIDWKASRWIPLETKEKNIKYTQASFEINPTDASLSGTLKISGLGYHALELRENYNTLGEKKYSESMLQALPTWENTKINYLDFKYNPDSLKIPVIQFETKVNDAFNMTNDRIYFNPMIIQRLDNNPFKNPDRTYPVDLTYLQEETFTASYQIPEGYVIEEMPKNVRFSMPNDAARYTYLAVQNENSINFSSKIQLKKIVYPVEEYSALREFYAQIVAKQAEQIVLKKK